MMNTEEPIFRNPRVIFEEHAGNTIQDPLNEARRVIFWDIIMLILPYVGCFPLFRIMNKEWYSMIPHSIIGIISIVFYRSLSSTTKELAENIRIISFYITMRKVLLLAHGGILACILYFIYTDWNRPQYADVGLDRHVHTLGLIILGIFCIPLLIYVIWLVSKFKGIIRCIQEDKRNN